MAAPPDSPLERFFRLLISRPVAVLMLVLALAGMSVIAASRIPIELLPAGFSSSHVSVTAPWPGANPEEVEQRVVRPLEEELRGIAGVQEVFSVSAEGSGTVVVAFPGNRDMDEAYAEVADRVERVRPRLPREVDRLFLRRMSMDEIPVMWCGVLYTEAERDEAQEIFAEVLQPRLEAIDGVATVSMEGLEPRSVRILLDENRVRANRVDVGALIQRLQADNLSVPVGDLDDAGTRAIIRVDGRFRSLEEIEALPVRPGLRIRDIGRVVAVRSTPDSLFRVNGRAALGMAITKETAANTFEVCQRVRQVVEEELPADPILGRFHYDVFFDQGEMIAQSLSGLIRDAAVGGLIACAVLFLFLRRLRYTLLIAVSIPFSVLMTLTWLYFTGRSFNLLTIMGITISIGMLVDNAVVIVEAILQRRERGDSLEQACVRGPAEMMLPVVTATLTSVVVFLPMIFMAEDRNIRLMTSSIGLPLCVALLAALLLAVVIVPVASRHLHRRGGDTVPPAGRLTALLGLPARAMPRLAAWAVRRRFRAATLALLVLVSGSWASSGSKLSDQAGGGGQMEIGFEFDASITLERALTEVQGIEAAIQDGLLEEIGNPDFGVAFNRQGGQLFLWHELRPAPEEERRIRDLLQERLPRRPGIRYRFEDRFQERSEDSGEWLRVLISGPDSQEVARLAAEVRRRARERPEFREVAEPEDPRREIRVLLDRERLQRAGATSTQVLGVIEWALRGLMVSRFQTPRGDVPIIMEFDEPEEPDAGRLRQLGVAGFRGGQALPLANFATFEHAQGPGRIQRRNGRTLEVVGVKPRDRDLKRSAAALAGLMESVPMPEGYRWEEGGGLEDFMADVAELRQAMLLAVALVFLLMGLLFESLILPFSVLITIAFAVTGAFWTFRLTGEAIDRVGMIGMIVLAGVVVNNGIVLVDRILHLEAGGLGREAAVRQAVADRLRPVVMTAVTTICGLLPIALSRPDGNGISFQGLAIGVSGGLAFSTFFTLWVVPLLYSLLQDLGRVLSREIGGRLLGRGSALASRAAGGDNPPPVLPEHGHGV